MKHIQFFLFFSICNLLFSQNSYMLRLNENAFGETIKEAKAALKTNKKDSMAIYAIGVSHSNLGDPERAIKYLGKAQEMGINTLPLKYNLALNYAVLGKDQKALDLLQEIANAGGPRYDKLDIKEFEGLKNQQQFKEIKKQMYLSARPCEADSNYRKFDFWIGEWEVYVNGVKVADSKISHSNDKCAILEDYRTLGVFAGNSISYFDPANKRWKQNWVSSGNVSHYVEADKPYQGDLCLIAEQNLNGKATLLRMTFVDNGNNSISQFIESSIDGGKSWTNSFKGLYKSKK